MGRVARDSDGVMILVIDNFDSFTYNLVQCLGALGAPLTVKRNDEIALTDVERLAPAAIVVSPGPGRPEEAGIAVDVIRRFGARLPVLGVCLGHQAIATAFGGAIVRAPRPIHGKTSVVDHDRRGLFAGIPTPLEVARYHSLTIDDRGLPADLEVAGRSRDDGTVMAVRHRRWPVHGVQFHPESILTPEGPRLLENFLQLVAQPVCSRS